MCADYNHPVNRRFHDMTLVATDLAVTLPEDRPGMFRTALSDYVAGG